MLKLLKYELIGSYRQFFLVFLSFILGCIIIPFLPFDIKEFSGAIVLMAAVGISISIFISIILNFLKSMYKKPGYLTLTLPVSTKELVISKILGAFIWSALGTVVLGIGAIIITLSLSEVNLGEFFKELFEVLSKMGNYVATILQFLTTMAMSVIFMITSMYFVITLVQTKYIPRFKVFIGTIGYAGISVGINLLFSNSLFQNFYKQLDGTGMFIFVIIMLLIGTILFFIGTVFLIDHKIEVE